MDPARKFQRTNRSRLCDRPWATGGHAGPDRLREARIGPGASAAAQLGPALLHGGVDRFAPLPRDPVVCGILRSDREREAGETHGQNRGRAGGPAPAASPLTDRPGR
ncbi:hypothetical protein EAT49_09120 [Histidinibacterium lentulum]|uniref:Uncharacterized protein n=1 Tax=Histidinibacterium lentulum TaxID=2480588 RepID=A0A3N2R4R8_9RHOB|nr:hypothetical protein EAT49_09120 [Histidinibacterium lentulum]